MAILTLDAITLELDWINGFISPKGYPHVGYIFRNLALTGSPVVAQQALNLIFEYGAKYSPIDDLLACYSVAPLTDLLPHHINFVENFEWSKGIHEIDDACKAVVWASCFDLMDNSVFSDCINRTILSSCDGLIYAAASTSSEKVRDAIFELIVSADPDEAMSVGAIHSLRFLRNWWDFRGFVKNKEFDNIVINRSRASKNTLRILNMMRKRGFDALFC
jgi:hypothetical protein